MLFFPPFCIFLHFFPFFSVFSVGGRTKGGLGLYGLGFRRKLIFFCGKFFTRTLRVHHSNALLTALIRHTQTHTSMPVGNLRTAANNDQDDDPRALRPIPIATKDMVSFVEKNNNAAGQNAEVVRFMFFNGFPQRLDLIVSRTMMMRESALLLVLLFSSSFRERNTRERERNARYIEFSRLRLRISFSLSRAHIFYRQSK